ncbi:MAG: helical backbone metal receptor, partial [Cyclobacteriaceae bacterium]
LGRIVMLQKPPARIVSLVPSLTELLFSLGLKEQMVGRTKFCIHPSNDIDGVEIVGGTKKFSVERIKALHPDLIIANKEENDRKLVDQLTDDFPVWVSDVSDLYSAIDLIHGIGRMTSTEVKAHLISETILQSFSTLKPLHRYNALYFIWKDPWMVAGRNTFIHDMMNRAGMINLVTEDRYPAIEEAQLDQYDPDVVFLSSEPYPFAREHRIEMEKRFPRASVKLVNGEYFSWYGSRLLESAKYFQSLIKVIAAPA